VSDCIIYIIHYILAYIQHNGDVSLEKFPMIWQKTSRCATNVLLKERKWYIQHNYLLLCVLILIGYMFRPYMQVIFRPLY